MPDEIQETVETQSDLQVRPEQDSALEVAQEQFTFDQEFPNTSAQVDEVIDVQVEAFRAPATTPEERVERLDTFAQGLRTPEELKVDKKVTAEDIESRLIAFIKAEENRETTFVKKLHERAQLSGNVPESQMEQEVLKQFSQDLDQYVDRLIDSREITNEVLQEIGLSEEEQQHVEQLSPFEKRAFVRSKVKFADFAKSLVSSLQ